MEDISIKIQELEQITVTRRDEVSTLKEQFNSIWTYVSNAAYGQILQFRALMKVLPLAAVQEMAAYINESDYTECPEAYSVILSEIKDKRHGNK